MSEIQELSKWMSREGRDNAVEALLPTIMACTTKTSRGRMPQILAELMPKSLETLLPKLSKEDRVDFVLHMISILVEKGSIRLSECEKREFIFKIEKQIRF